MRMPAPHPLRWATQSAPPLSPISDILLVIQMQGSQITSSNSIAYGDGSTGSGISEQCEFIGGKMEYVVAASAVAFNGGTRTLTIQSRWSIVIEILLMERMANIPSR